LGLLCAETSQHVTGRGEVKICSGDGKHDYPFSFNYDTTTTIIKIIDFNYNFVE
jgi:hypothetical protein